MSGTDGLTVFWAARLDEAEAAANVAAVDPVGAMEDHFKVAALEHEQDWRHHPERKTDYDRGQADALHWASAVVRERMLPLSLHDPASVLADVAADRALLALLGQAVREDDYDVSRVLREVASIRAARFSGHPDWREEWRP